ncbi:MAG: hypothetical protein E7277_04170 [Lachnospiraceae bacterium]|nr:hypothetical protein [Lachnospiraceae bacterium]
MKRKEFLKTLMVLTLTSALLVGCIGTSTASAESTDAQSTTQQNTPPTPPDGQTPPDKPDGQGGGPGQNSATVEANGATEITKSTKVSGKTYKSTTSDQNALLVKGDISTTLSNIKVTKSGDSEGGDSNNFYGTNSGILAKDKAVVNISGATIKTTANGANGTFSYGGNGAQNSAAGDGTTINISDSSITTTGDQAGGIMTAGGGTTNATNLTIKTSGRSSAAIRSDRGGGTVNVNGGSYTTSGVGSPAIYSTAKTTVKNATLTSTTSEGVVIEGMNSVVLENTNLTAENTKLNGNATEYNTVMLYQSMSGDAANGTSLFTANGGSITSKKGNVFYVTNTSAQISLRNVAIKNEDSSNVLLKVAEGGWGKSGSNGGNVTFSAAKQQLSGNIIVDSSSTLNLLLSDGSTYEGAINTDGTAGSVYVEVPEGCTWKLTGDSYISSLSCVDGSIDLNGYTLTVGSTTYTSGSSTGKAVNNIAANVLTKDASVKPTGTSVSSVANTSSKKVTVKWTKDASADGYQIRYTTKENGKTVIKTKTIKSKNTVKTTLSGLTKGNTYSVSIRSYKTVKGKKVYSSYSTTKKVKIRK